MERHKRKPDWLKISLPKGKSFLSVREIVERNKLNTICSSGKCPNMSECWSNGTASFMILGDICTRSCKFCATNTGKPLPPDIFEPMRLADTIQKMKLKHCVITSVDRDDLSDGGATAWAATVRKIKEVNPDTSIETLIPDFNGKEHFIQLVIDAGPEIVSHNMETVNRLTPVIRSRAKYFTSLKTLEVISRSGKTKSKSGIMVGLGETKREVHTTMDDLLNVGCSILTIGQYLQPTLNNWPVHEYITPEQFDEYKVIALQKGFKYVESAPLVRSSYRAEKHL